MGEKKNGRLAGAFPRATWPVGVVAFIAGLLFATSASVFQNTDDTTARSLPALVQEESHRLAEQTEEVEELRTEVAALEAALVITPHAPTDAEALATGLGAVTGPGVSVVLDDAPASATSPNPDDLVVHQQDLQGVVNALWAGGAEAIAIQGERVIATTAIRCVGNVLLLGGRTYSPPYTIEAIGDPESMQQALQEDATLQRYREYVSAFGLGWKVTDEDELVLDAYAGARTLTYALPLEETS